MVRYFLISILCLAGLTSFAQNKADSSHQYIHKGLISAQATISVGYLTHYQETTIFLHGNLEYYVNKKISIRSDAFYFLNSTGNDEPFLMDHSLFTGASYHFQTKNHIDPYVGFQPGMALAQSCFPSWVSAGNVSISSYQTYNPLVSGYVGFNYFGDKIFHLFIEVRYLNGKYMSNLPAMSLNEVRLSFGLGWNIL